MNEPRPSLFRPESLEARRTKIYGEVVLPSTRTDAVLTVATGILAIALCAWAVLTYYPRTLAIDGEIVTPTPTVRVYPTRTGLVTNVYVKEGQAVLRGAPLVRVSTQTSPRLEEAATSSLAIRESLLQDQLVALNDRARLDAARSTADLRQLETQARSLAAQAAAQEQIVGSLKAALERIKDVAERGFISKDDYEQRQQAYLGAQKDLELLRINIAANEAAQEKARLDSQQVPVALAQSRRDALQAQVNLPRDQAEAADNAGYDLLAAIPGRVTAIQASAGQIADARAPLLAIVPPSDHMLAQLALPASSKGLVRVGQAVSVEVAAYPSRQYGALHGVVSSITQTTAELPAGERDGSATAKSFIVWVSLQPAVAGDRTASLELRPGMAVRGRVALEGQTVFRTLMGQALGERQ